MTALPFPIELDLIGIGSGNPDHVTRQAVAAINAADLILLPRKGAAKDDLAELRRVILGACLTNPATRVVEFDLPARATGHADYAGGVGLWHDQIAEAWAGALRGAGPAPRVPVRVALLVWGDPSLFDSSLRVARRLTPAPRIRALPGISALHALTAAHAIPLNTTGQPVVITTGRRLRERGWPGEADSVAVFVDADGAFRHLPPEGIRIWWGAYVGMAQELLDHGPLAEAGPRILSARAAARARHGWIMDLYLLRRTGD
ncbi:precorrin-6A synthase (deacetylating) [Frigidibacter sp. ROC022]|uniref:precorrin-6A synthase (deacetylating) n=1 Tax=Frigidibacter sp. ROC022 TaxID=2971796 RepID=UPI00215A4471|nr:precorrin-6A synthase (deacetylating) [Frigidibacter sp. ROC022]MCR8726229.1 precorrin-6A synthase (deacetylating) [Frigidibacter sp. ROC022]